MLRGHFYAKEEKAVQRDWNIGRWKIIGRKWACFGIFAGNVPGRNFYEPKPNVKWLIDDTEMCATDDVIAMLRYKIENSGAYYTIIILFQSALYDTKS